MLADILMKNLGALSEPASPPYGEVRGETAV